MFRRLILEDWQNLLIAVAFLLILSGFIALVVRSLRMRRQDREYMAGLPLKDDDGQHLANQPRKPSKSRSDEA